MAGLLDGITVTKEPPRKLPPMEFYFLPAVTTDTPWSPAGGCSIQRVTRVKEKEKRPYYPNWMDPVLREAGAYYPHILISYYGLRGTALRMPADGFILGDSGGFSVMRYGMGGLDAGSVLRWQNKLCTVGVIIDKPPAGTNGQPADWNQSLDATANNTERAVDVYRQLRKKGTAFRWWGVVHGWDDKQRDIWWKRISDIYPFTDAGEGWAMRARPTAHDPVSIAYGINWLRKKKIKRTHFFAALGYRQAATVIVLAPQAGLETATIDSSGMVTTYARNRGITIPTSDGLRYNTLKESIETPGGPAHLLDLDNRTYREARDYLLGTCTCYSCQVMQEHAKDENHPLHEGKGEQRWTTGASSSYWLFRFEFHNLLILRDIIENLKREAALDPDALLKEVLGDQWSTVVRASEGQEPLRKSGKGVVTEESTRIGDLVV